MQSFSRKAWQVVATFFICLTIATVHGRGEIRLPSLISDGMVLQQGIKVGIWGAADPGESVTVALNGQKLRAVSDAAGEWKVKLEPMKAGGPFEMTIAGKNTITLRDILVGEVWVCSGQSNMEWPVKSSLHAAEEIAAADYPMMRLFTVKKVVAAKPQREVSGTWRAVRPSTIDEFSAVGYFFGRELHKVLGVPIGLINNAWGGTTAEAWTSHPTLEADPEYKAILDRGEQAVATYPTQLHEFEQQYSAWKQAAELADREGRPLPLAPKIPSDPRESPWARPSGLYNGMLAPLTPYAIAGVIWYQGESNADRAIQYRKLFPALIRDWRNAWGQGDFPFLFVQLAYFANVYPQYNWNWPLLQEAQLKTLTVPRTAMAVAIDIGDAGDIHPKNKQEVGHRLALAAQAVAYGRPVIYSGPLYDSMSIENDRIRLHFNHVHGGLLAKSPSGGPLTGFEIADDDRKFVPAEDRVEGDTVVVSSSKVLRPVVVRYGFAWIPQCNLYNQAGLPASPFRTDDWPPSSESK